ncbi:MAG: tetratricopeptide repeat protein [Planctomycetota bacterium]
MNNRIFQSPYWIVSALVMLAATLLVYLQVSDHGFVQFDDPDYVTENRWVREGLTQEGVAWAFTTGEAANWHPLTWLSHMMDCSFFGMDAGGHHMMSLLLHGVNSLLLLLVLMRMTGTMWRSFFVAAAFALHPLHVESVAWVAERKDLLSTFFWLWTMWLYLSYAERPGLIRWICVIAGFMAGLLAKPMLVTLPFVLLLVDFWPLNRTPLSNPRPQGESNGISAAGVTLPRKPVWQLVMEKTALFALSGTSCVITYLVQQSGGAMSSMESFPFHRRIANAFVSYIKYMLHTMAPVELSPFYPHSPGAMAWWHWAGAALIIIVLTIMVLRVRQRFGYLFLGWFWYLGTLVPVIGLIQVGEQAMADRYTYVPLIGLFIAVAWGAADLLSRFRFGRRIGAIVLVVTLAACAALTWRQAAHWRDSITLFEHAVSVDGDNYLARNNLGAVLNREGKSAEALSQIRRALQIKPDYQDAHNNLGVILDARGDHSEAITHFLEAVRLDPGDEKAHYNLANALVKTGAMDDAITHYEYAIEIDPGYSQAYNNLGVVLINTGRLAEAIANFSMTLRLSPDHFNAHIHIAAAWAKEGNSREAIRHYRSALAIKPEALQALDGLAWLLATQQGDRSRSASEAIELAQRACSMTRNEQPQYLDTLAAALAANERFEEARQCAGRAVTMAEKAGQSDLAQKIRMRQNLYADGRKCEESTR